MPISVLNRRQARHYQHRVDVWEEVRNGVNPESLEPGETYWRRVLVDEPVHYDFTQNIDQATEAGRVTAPGQFTRDTIHAAANLPLKNGNAIINKTLLPDGSPSLRYGQCTLIQGDPDVVEGNYGRVNKQMVEGITTPHPDNWITLEYRKLGDPLT